MPRRLAGRTTAEVGTAERSAADEAGDMELLQHVGTALQMYAGRKSVLQFKVAGEEGTGEGPTRQFYTDVAAALQRRSLCLWRGSSQGAGESTHVYRREGLFPAVLPRSEDAAQQVLERFTLLGRLVARALQDGHLIDMPFSAAFRKLMVGGVLSIADLPDVDVALAKVLLPLHQVAQQVKAIRKQELDPQQAAEAIAELRVGGIHKCKVEDLSLTMSYDQDELTAEGVPTEQVRHELVLDGGDTEVSVDNVQEYVELMAAKVLVEGVQQQMDAFQEGFNEVFPMRQLRIYSAGELEIKLGGKSELDWTEAELTAAIAPQHGYDTESSVYRDFIQGLLAMSETEKRRFLTWITGCPRQPVGGLAALVPKMTILRKDPSDGMSIEDTMPSAQTCHHIVKMPPYDDKSMMMERLITAITNPDVQQFLFN